ncbi:hypothetical protein GCM10009555_103390 [Acrocarpospora macrocephala]|uniref:HTH luxR-type domain-containing protein n=1 Tax=Acrocarpospora macrocephala TaxID=150177 RepID=A0A5M3WJP5_9ACTN|nr:hypothetical protein [Acrocarpospora macrocephala]GES07263.1 hypothetical protein Amac_008580 [Acrocarpospora macrocephala]
MMTRWGDGTGEPPPFTPRDGDADPLWEPKPLPGQVDVPSPRELEWLRHLSTVATVAELADRVGYSEPMMSRLLDDLYKRMQARDRTEALRLARERGWL